MKRFAIAVVILLAVAGVMLILLTSAVAGEPLKILHNMRYADPTGENSNPWLFSREVGNSAGGVFCQLLAHGKIFSKPGVVDFEKRGTQNPGASGVGTDQGEFSYFGAKFQINF